mmetsp:Transcript_1091/g.2265  ORF Transcript_1091/g.2265 Transcript_1091/m.2265 type:complete len:285 (+) Transcript_1091:742-1596(+)
MALASVDVQHFSISNTHFADGVAFAHAIKIKGFVPLHIGHGGHDSATSGLGQSFEIFSITPTGAYDSRFDKVLHAQIVHSLGREDDTSPGIDNLSNALFGNVHLALFDILNLFRILDNNLHAHPHPMPLKVHIQHGNPNRLSIRRLHKSGHTLRCPHTINRKPPINKIRFHGRLPMRFQNVNGRERVLVPLFLPRVRGGAGGHGGGSFSAAAAHGFVAGDVCRGGVHLDGLDCVDGELGEEVHFCANDFGGHGSLGGVDEVFVSQFGDVDDHFLFDVGDGCLQC